MEYQTSMYRGQPDDEAIKMIQYYEGLALELDERGYCVCTSEGKDSRVLGDLYRRSGVKHFYAHSITGIDPPELVYFQRRNFEDYKSMGYLTYELWYRKSMWQMMIDNLIPPTRWKRYCCAELKERRHDIVKGCLFSFGVRKYESVNRLKNRDELEVATKKKKDNIILSFDNDENRRTFESCSGQGELRVNPIAYWTDSDIWSYSKDRKLEQCCMYSKGFHRLGCQGCPMGTPENRKRDFAYHPKIERLWKNAFNKMYHLRIKRGDDMEFQSGKEWFESWLNEKWTSTDDSQLEMEFDE